MGNWVDPICVCVREREREIVSERESKRVAPRLVAALASSMTEWSPRGDNGSAWAADNEWRERDMKEREKGKVRKKKE